MAVAFQVAALVVLCVGSVWAQTVVVTTCDDMLCSEGCTSEPFNTDQCLPSNSSGAVAASEWTCSKPQPAAMCASFTGYRDAECATPIGNWTNLCSGCQSNYSIACGGLFNALYWHQNCTDAACESCTGAQIVAFGQCERLWMVSPLDVTYVVVHGVTACQQVTNTEYANAGCTAANGSAIATLEYSNGACQGGTTVVCQPEP